MQYFPAEALKNVYNPYHQPIGIVAPSETFQIETEDCFGGRFRAPEGYTKENIAWVAENLDVVNGPVAVTGACKGQVVAVTIEAIEVTTPGSLPLSRWSDPSPQDWWLEEYACRSMPVVGGMVHLSEQLKVPVRPVIGCLATAPAHEVILSRREGHYGGNLDCSRITAGATVILPVQVDGALLYFGDCKAVMGDGEVVNAPEVGALITAQASLRPMPTEMNWPRIETPDWFVTVVSDISLSTAARLAFRELLLWVEADYGLTHEEAAILLGMVANTAICQVSNTFHTARCEVPRKYLENLTG